MIRSSKDGVARAVFALILVSTALPIVGCKEPQPTGDMVDQSLVGSWVMLRDETIRLQKKVYKEAGILKINQDVFDFQKNFDSLHFTIDFYDDATFDCSMGEFGQNANFSGYWSTDGDKVAVVQTHENDKPKKDKMEGTYDENSIRLIHQQNDLSIPYVFTRNTSSMD